jgi:hypothetical protein
MFADEGKADYIWTEYWSSAEGFKVFGLCSDVILIEALYSI